MSHIPGLSPKILLAAADQDIEQFFDLLAAYTPIELVGALATTAYSLAVELYGSPERAREVFAAMALAADVDQAMSAPPVDGDTE
ncbi:hypothetical protein [Micromonospora sp. NPDC049204]|uniref:hypothetical protein n=1 Tax=Micromonospora sp. NPDC049204 TaxID=3154351 RepID=UPI0033E58130